MKILLPCHDLTTLLRRESTRTAAGAVVLKRASSETPHGIVTGLGRNDACSAITQLRAQHRAVGTVACAAKGAMLGGSPRATVTARAWARL